MTMLPAEPCSLKRRTDVVGFEASRLKASTPKSICGALPASTSCVRVTMNCVPSPLKPQFPSGHTSVLITDGKLDVSDTRDTRTGEPALVPTGLLTTAKKPPPGLTPQAAASEVLSTVVLPRLTVSCVWLPMSEVVIVNVVLPCVNEPVRPPPEMPLTCGAVKLPVFVQAHVGGCCGGGGFGNMSPIA